MTRHKAEWFGPRLRELREAAGLTQVELGQLAGIVGSQINKLELGVNQPTLATAMALAAGLGVDMNTLVAAAQKKTKPPAAKATADVEAPGKRKKSKGKK